MENSYKKQILANLSDKEIEMRINYLEEQVILLKNERIRRKLLALEKDKYAKEK